MSAYHNQMDQVKEEIAESRQRVHMLRRDYLAKLEQKGLVYSEQLGHSPLVNGHTALTEAKSAAVNTTAAAAKVAVVRKNGQVVTLADSMDYKTSRMAELHVYVVPPDLWREHLNSAVNQIINDTVSAGFIRVSPDMTVNAMRDELEIQLGFDVIPREFVFLKSVGRCLARLKAKQEYALKVRNFLPPQAYCPEIFLLEASPDSALSGMSSERSYNTDQQRVSDELLEYEKRRLEELLRKEKTSGKDKKSTNSTKKDSTTHPSRKSNQVESASQPNKRQTVLTKETNKLKDNKHLNLKKTIKPSEQSPKSTVNSLNSNQILTDDKYEKNLNTPPSNLPSNKTKKTFSKYTKPQPKSKKIKLAQNETNFIDKQAPVLKNVDKFSAPKNNESLNINTVGSNISDDLPKPNNRVMTEMEWNIALSNAAGLGTIAEEAPNSNKTTLQNNSNYHLNNKPKYASSGKQRELEELERQRKLMEEEEERRRRLEEEARNKPVKPITPPPREIYDKERLIAELEIARRERREMERRREELVKRAKYLQTKTKHRRNQARDLWKKKYFDEKKKTPPLEDSCTRLRQELDGLHRRIMSQLEGPRDKEGKRINNMPPSEQSNAKINAARLSHEIDDLHRKTENIKMRLTAEMKLRNQAEAELKILRSELTQKKINITLTRNQQMNAIGSNSVDYYTPREPILSPHS